MKNISGAQKIIEKSGNSLHSQTTNLLRNLGWEVLVSPYYSDNFTDKPREIDIIAEKKIDVNDFGEQWLGTLDVRLFIECKYITRDTVFWFDNKDKQRATELIMTNMGMEHPRDNINIEVLHYFSDTPVAKLFASEKNRGEEYEIMTKAINQNLNALVYYRNKTDLMPVKPNRQQNMLGGIYYPIIVCNSFDNFYRTDIVDEKQALQPIVEPFQLEINYAYINKERDARNEYFLIDVVSVDKLDDFLSKLAKSDFTEIRNKIGFEMRTKG